MIQDRSSFTHLWPLPQPCPSTANSNSRSRSTQEKEELMDSVLDPKVAHSCSETLILPRHHELIDLFQGRADQKLRHPWDQVLDSQCQLGCENKAFPIDAPERVSQSESKLLLESVRLFREALRRTKAGRWSIFPSTGYPCAAKESSWKETSFP